MQTQSANYDELHETAKDIHEQCADFYHYTNALVENILDDDNEWDARILVQFGHPNETDTNAEELKLINYIVDNFDLVYVGSETVKEYLKYSMVHLEFRKSQH
jgi:hypothetical protein